MIPQEPLSATSHPPSIPVQIVPLTQPKIQSQHMITTHPSYIQQSSTHEWSNYQPQHQQPTLNIATTAVRGLPTYSHYHSQQQHHDLLPATTNVINTAGVPQHEQQQIVAERISSILASSPHDQQPTTTTATVTQTPIQIKRAWPINQHQQSDNHLFGKFSLEKKKKRKNSFHNNNTTDLFSHTTIMTIAVNGDGEFKVIKTNIDQNT